MGLAAYDLDDSSAIFGAGLVGEEVSARGFSGGAVAVAAFWARVKGYMLTATATVGSLSLC